METPAIIIDQAIMEHNLQKMAELARRHGVELRPHIKTHKLPELAKRQLAYGAVGITVAKVSEAEVMAEHGVDNIFIAYPIVVSSKADRIVHLARHHTIIVGVDSESGARLLSEKASAAGLKLKIRMELDSGLQRTGVGPEDAVELGRLITELPGLELDGIFTFKGALLQGAPTLDLEAAGLEEGELMTRTAACLRAAGIPIRHVSVGSSPTAASVAAVAGVTEIRPGTYIFNDRMLTKMGLCELRDVAARVRVTVVSVPTPHRAIVDGGSKTFATDVQPGKAPLNLVGFGEIVGYPKAVLERMNEEHGIIVSEVPHGWRVGDTIEIIPNHICSTVNLHNTVWLHDIAEMKMRQVPVAGRGMLT